MSNDIRTDPETLRVYWEMMPPSKFMHDHEQLKIEATNNDLIEFCRCLKCGCEWAYSTQTGYSDHNHDCPVPDPITVPIGNLAFWMMDQCNYKVFRDKLYNEVGPRDSGSYTDGYLKATPEQWIRAACKAWDSRAAQRRE